MSKLWRDVGTITGVDVETRAVVDSQEIPIPLAVARETLGRAPNIDTDEVVAWGGITGAEAELLLQTEPDHEDRLSCLEEVARMMEHARDREVRFCVYYSRRAHVE
jgi:hypothetical protein